MKLVSTLSLAILATRFVSAQAEDTFNYGPTDGSNYGPSDWGKVKCDNHATCVSHFVSTM
jgi:hypothetical protein